jgi:peptidoglycan/LPS O-acetylase OafA/YrhL
MKGRVWQYLNQAALPFYIVHYAIIALVAYFVLPWTIPLVAQFLLISSGALLLTLVVYELLIRRIPFMRWLFGVVATEPHDARSHTHATA